MNGLQINLSFNRPVQLDSHVSDFRYTQAAPFQNVTNLSECKTVVPPSRFIARESRTATKSRTTKEPGKCQMDSVKRVVKDICVNGLHVLTYLLDFGQLSVLIKPRDSSALLIPRITALSQRGVVKLAAHCQLIIERSLLSFSGVDPIPKGLDHIAIVL